MIRPITAQDRALYLSLMDEFYHSSAVLHPVNADYYVRAVDEMLARDTYLLGYLLEYDGQPAGYAMLARAYSTECGGPVLWIEELYVREALRSRGWAMSFSTFWKDLLGGSLSLSSGSRARKYRCPVALPPSGL